MDVLNSLENDVIFHYLANKPKITEATSIRVKFMFKKKVVAFDETIK